MGEAKDEAARTIIEFVKAPDMFQVLLNLGDPLHRNLPACLHEKPFCRLS
jgi:hypothetical protein